MDNQLLLFLVCVYGGVLFLVAWLSERFSYRLQQPWWRPLIYTLSIGVYCSSWTFLGAVGQSVESGLLYLPIYLGPILLFVFGWRFLRRLLTISSRNKVTSIADFIGSRYGKNQRLAAIVTLVLVVGTLPYIALQLRAVGIAWSTIHWDQGVSLGVDSVSSLIAAFVMAWFAVLFGTSVIDGPNRLRGMVTAVAVESIIKLVAFIVVAWLAFKVLNSETQLTASGFSPEFSIGQVASPLFFTELLLAAVAIVCLPRQFHLLVVEYQERKDLKYARWMVPLYLALFAILVIPLAQAGSQVFGGLNIDPDSYVLILSSWAGNEWTLALTFIGALSAATGMVVVATIALSIMISNELIVPSWLHINSRRNVESSGLGTSLRLIRRISIVLILMMAWGLERLISNAEGLAAIGLISFAATAQLMPAVLGALYWSKGHAVGVIKGLLAGMALWFYCLLLPVVLNADHSLVVNGPLHISWLAPHNLFGSGWLDPLSHGVFWSLLANIGIFIYASSGAKFSPLDLRQADAFTQLRLGIKRLNLNLEPSKIEVQQLQTLMTPLFGQQRTLEIWQGFEQRIGHRLLPHDPAPKFVVHGVESDLAAIIGAVSAHRSVELLATQKPLALDDIVSLVSGSSRQIQFSQTLLQTTIETIPQGISVVDKDLKLVAWNQRYQDLFDYPQRLLYVGCDVEKIYHFNARRGYLKMEGQKVGAAVERRLVQLRSSKPHRLERALPTGEVIDIRGTPLANGGYVTTYTDVSEYHEMLGQLAQAKENLEDRVHTRTAELRKANDLLKRENDLRALVEQELKEVHVSKSRFMAAASHDLLQPINAARLFVASLSDKVALQQDSSVISDVNHLDNALAATEQLISSLREISRLGSGKERPKREHFTIDSILRPLASEAQALAAKQDLLFDWVPSTVWVYSDPHLLRRVVQNFISNALRYTQTGRVIMGCRRKKDRLVIEVWDTGPGIAETDRERIFEEFERLPGPNSNFQGLGLGLSIAQQISQLLSHPLSVESTLGKGSVFRMVVGVGEKQAKGQKRVLVDPQLTDLHVLCIDNDQSILAGMQSLLEQWGCRVTTAANLRQALSRWPEKQAPELILADYHLDTETGLDVLEALSYHWQQKLSAIVISADNSDALLGRVKHAEFLYLPKPVQPNALRALMRRALRKSKINAKN